MKRIFALTIILVVCFINAVYAASYNVELVGSDSVAVQSEFEIAIKLKDLSDIGGSANGMNVVILTLNFDSNKLEKQEVTGLNGFSVTDGTKLVIDKADGVSQDTEIAKIQFKVKDTAAVGDTATIELTNISGSNGSMDIASTNSVVVKTVRIIEKKSNHNNQNSNQENNSGTGSNSRKF